MYCFAYFFKSNNPAIKSIQLKAVNAERMISALRGKPQCKRGRLLHKHFYSKKFLLHWGGLADPFCHFESHNQVGLKLINVLGELNYPTLFSFKGPAIFKKDYVKVFEKYADQHNFAFQVSIITGSDRLGKKIEIGTPLPSMRIKALRMLSDMGYWTILRLRPFIIGITDIHLDELLQDALDAGINAISTEFFALDARANKGMKQRYDWLSQIIGVKGGAQGLMQYFSRLSPSERGGYMRLNRLIKEPYIKKMYKFCTDNNILFACSDPDFKELNMSGSCCGMPDKYSLNSRLTNWTRSQLSYHLKEARKIYHKSNGSKVIELRFNQVYGEDSYLDEHGFTDDHVAIIGKCCADRYALTQRSILQSQWNNLRSPANPYNYFHGQVRPSGVDSDGNFIFVYSPSEYEARWKAEGIDLTK